MRQGPSASSVAARIGRAAFLLPVGWIVPLSGRPPETQNDGGIGERKLRRALRARQAFANVRRVNPVLALGLLAFAGLLAPRLPALATVWTPRLPAVLGLAAVAAVSGPRVVTAVAQAVGLRGSASRALERAAALETACGTVVMTVPLALHPSQLGAGNPELGWVSWIVFATGCGVLVGLVFLSVTRLRPAREEARLALAASMLFGAGIGYATDLSPFVVCALAAV